MGFDGVLEGSNEILLFFFSWYVIYLEYHENIYGNVYIHIIIYT